MSIGDFLETDAGFVWVDVARVRVYSCYFSPKYPFKIFETQILLLEESLRQASGTPLLRATLTISRPSGEKNVRTGGEYWSVRWSLGMT